ncbi:hypothetical protein L208DRAFT_1126002, partial [Tricholoma matsutake]
PLLAVDTSHCLPSLDSVLVVDINNHQCRYILHGIIYYAADHFTARIVMKDGMVWFHNGIFTGSSLVYE